MIVRTAITKWRSSAGYSRRTDITPSKLAYVARASLPASSFLDEQGHASPSFGSDPQNRGRSRDRDTDTPFLYGDIRRLRSSDYVDFHPPDICG